MEPSCSLYTHAMATRLCVLNIKRNNLKSMCVPNIQATCECWANNGNKNSKNNRNNSMEGPDAKAQGAREVLSRFYDRVTKILS